MSFYYLNANTTAQTLADGEFGFIGPTGSLVVDSGTAVSVSGSVLVSVYGVLRGQTSAIFAEANSVITVEVGETGFVRGDISDTVAGQGLGGAFVSNHGTIRSGEDALDLRLAAGGTISIVNTGKLVATSDAIVTDAGSGLAEIRNTGTMKCGDGGIDHLGGESTLFNTGRIEGVGYAFDGDDQQDAVENRGVIIGGVFLYAQNDSVVNRGTIDSVDLGGGEDFYIGQGSGSAGSVNGGGGRDALIGSRANDDFTGGGASDYFAFGRRGGADVVEDFGRTDRIDLSDFGFERFGELRGHLEERRDGVLIDLSDDGTTVLLKGVDLDDLRASQFLLEPVTMDVLL